MIKFEEIPGLPEWALGNQEGLYKRETGGQMM